MAIRRDGGGGDVFKSMYDRYYSRMLKFFRTVFHVSDEDANDLTQDSFLRFYTMLDEYRGDAEWALLEKIARNVGYNRVRSLSTIKRGAYRTESLDEAESGHRDPNQQQEPIDQLIDAERRARLRAAIKELPKGQRQCLQLRLEDRPIEEIAAALRISEDAVRSRIRDARRALRQRLGEGITLPEE